MLLAACADQPGTYQADPQMDSIVAGATQTAAGQRINETTVARQATQQAVIYQATQVAQATRSAYEATAQAAESIRATTQAAFASQTAVAATATTQRQNEINALIGEETRVALMFAGTREALSIQATATAVQRDMDDDLARRERRRVWGNVALGGVTSLAILLGAALVWRVHKGGQAFFNDNGQIVAIERSIGGIVVLPIRQQLQASSVVIDQPPPVLELPRSVAPREIPGMVGGQPRTFAVDQNDEVRPETWRALAVALLVHCANFSRNGVMEHTTRAGWRWGSLSQPEYNKAFQFMEKNGYLRPGKGAENNLTDKGYDWLLRWVPNSSSPSLPRPELSTVDLLNTVTN